jgi:hypothetical protein
MKNNSFFKAGMLAAALMFAAAVIGCGKTLPKLPSPTGTNEVGGKTYQGRGQKWEFGSDGTYRYFAEDEGAWEPVATGNYSWDSSGSFKTVTLAPQQGSIDGSTFYDKAGWKAAARSYYAANGLTDEDIVAMTDGQYTTITASIDARADYNFALQMCNYTMSGETIGTFVEMGAYGYGNEKGGKVVVQNDTASALTVVTHDAGGTANAAVSTPAGESRQVFESGADTFLKEIGITTGGSIAGVEIEKSHFFRSYRGVGGRYSYETGPMCVGGGRTITITVE